MKKIAGYIETEHWKATLYFGAGWVVEPEEAGQPFLQKRLNEKFPLNCCPYGSLVKEYHGPSPWIRQLRLAAERFNAKVTIVESEEKYDGNGRILPNTL